MLIDPVYCVACKKALGVTEPFCRHCGASQARGAAAAAVSPAGTAGDHLPGQEPIAAAAPAPPGWVVEPLPGGRVRLAPTLRTRLDQGASPFVLLVAAGGALVYTLVRTASVYQDVSRLRVPQPAGAALPWLLFGVGGVCLCLAVFLAAGVRWSALARVEIHAGPDWLEVRRSWLGLLRSGRRRYGAGTSLVFDTVERFNGRARVLLDRLLAENVSGSAVLDEQDMGLAGDLSRIQGLGAFLSRHTGWQVIDRRPENRKWL